MKNRLFLLCVCFLYAVHSVHVVSPQEDADARFAESQANFPSLSKIVNTVTNAVSAISSKSARFNGASTYIKADDEKCVMCQYYIQRLQSSMVQYALQFHTESKSFLEVEMQIQKHDDAHPPVGHKDVVKEDWGLSLETAKETVAAAFRDDEIPLKQKDSVLNEETFYAPIETRKSHPVASHDDKEIEEIAAKAALTAVRQKQSTPQQSPPFPANVRFISKPSKPVSTGPSPKMIAVSASRRQRVVEARMATPVTMRFLSPNGEFEEMETTLFNDFQSICGDQPLAYGPYCDHILEQFPFIVQKLDSRDTPQRICLNLEFCSSSSYAVGAPHALEEVPEEMAKQW